MGQVETSQRREETQANRVHRRVRTGSKKPPSMKDLAASGVLGCAGCSLASAGPPERLEMEDSRQNSNRPQLKTHRVPSSSSGERGTQMNLTKIDEMGQLKQVLWKLQQENAELKGEVGHAGGPKELTGSTACTTFASSPFAIGSVATPQRSDLHAGFIPSHHSSEKARSHLSSGKSSDRSSEKSSACNSKAESGSAQSENEVRRHTK